jgi:hypothetical protein
MSDASEIVLRVAGLSLLVAAALTLSWTWRARYRWGFTRGPATKFGDGPYRRGIMRTRAPRGVPRRIVLAAGFGAVWGVLTCAVFTPGGLLFLLAPAHIDPRSQILLTLSGLGVFATSLGGVALGLSIVRTSRALALRAPDIIERAIPTALWSVIHHGLVIVSFLFFAVHERSVEIGVAVSLVCSLGLVHSWVLARAAQVASRFRDEDDLRGA